MDTYETTIYHAVIVSSIVIGCILVFFIVSLSRQHRRRIDIQRKLFAEEINAVEKERCRMAHDLHDEAGPILSLARSYLSQIQPKEESQISHVNKVNELLKQLKERMNEIAIHIVPGSLAKKGLEFSLREFFGEIEAVCPLTIEFAYEVSSPIDLNRSLHLYRIVQEICHNTVKHSQASTLKVQIKEGRKKLYVLCRDNGVGFCYESGQGKGLGTATIRNRCEILHGQMKVYSMPEEGTDYFFEFPVDQSQTI
jgi:signal transduction histidine kinase